jgi:hypothetical protein
MGKLVSLLIFMAGLLAYGFYHERTHGSLYVNLNDSAQQGNQRRIFKDEITFLDGNGQTLARAKSDDKYGVVRLIHPVVGDCVSEEQSASSAPDGQKKWRACFEQQSTWLMSWVRQARYAIVKLDSCTAQRIPISIRESGDNWWLWWVPLRHIGGLPYRYFSVTFSIDRTKCAVVDGIAARNLFSHGGSA